MNERAFKFTNLIAHVAAAEKRNDLAKLKMIESEYDVALRESYPPFLFCFLSKCLKV